MGITKDEIRQMILEEYSKALMEDEEDQGNRDASTEPKEPTKQAKIKNAFETLKNYWERIEDLDLADELQKGRLQQLLKISKHLDDMQNQQDFSKYGYESVSGMEQDAQKGFELVKRIRNAQATKDQNAQVTKDKEAQDAKDQEATKDKEAKDKRLAKISDQHLLKMQQQYEKLKAIVEDDPENERAKELLGKLKASLEKHHEKGHSFAQMPTQVDKYDDNQIQKIKSKTIELLGNMSTYVENIVVKVVELYLKNKKKTDLDRFSLDEGITDWGIEKFNNLMRDKLKKHLETFTQDMQIDLDQVLKDITNPRVYIGPIRRYSETLKKNHETLKQYIDKAIAVIEAEEGQQK